jgi:hypothetical protein
MATQAANAEVQGLASNSRPTKRRRLEGSTPVTCVSLVPLNPSNGSVVYHIMYHQR